VSKVFRNFSRTLVWLLRIALALLFVAPLYWMLVIATGTQATVYAFPPVLLPQFDFGPFISVVTQTPWLQYAFNSVFITASTIVLVLLTSVLAGYALAELKFPGRNLLFILILGVLMLPGQALLIPQFALMYNLNLLDSYQGLIIPFAASTAGTFLFRQFFKQIPTSFREVALLEGVSTPRYLRKVAVPMAKPAVYTVALLTFISAWNEFQWPLIMTPNATNLYTVELALNLFYMNSLQGNWRVITAASALGILPIVAIFLFTQRHIISGVIGGDSGNKE
jgi:ABC-type glycerol-3-phosphate transport system permease component